MSGSVKLPLLVAAGLIVAVALIVRPRDGLRPVVGPARHDTTPSSTAQTKVVSPVDSSAGRADDRTEPVKAEFVYLFDVSTSTHPGGVDDPFERAARTLVPSIIALRQNELLMPQRHRVGTIGAASLMQEPLCDVRLEPPASFARRDTTIPNARIRACDAALRAHASEKQTDIRGALAFAALTLHGQRQIVRGIVLITDLEEALERGQVGAIPDLRGICVAAFSMVTPSAVARPDSLTLREQEWSAQLRSWGATRVKVQSILGFDAGDLEQYFRTCPASHFP
ncbi:MAG: hypothetical protein M3P12_02680 [Gemmatimonadota bacterium]|nr:hypothetical protein [Gemmatimonadota bacterium]